MPLGKEIENVCTDTGTLTTTAVANRVVRKADSGEQGR